MGPSTLRDVVVLGTVMVLHPFMASAQTPSPADGPWSGQAECTVTTRGTDYQEEQIHTWRITSSTPQVAGSIRRFPAVWSVQGRGTRSARVATGSTRTTEERWTISVPETSAPISVWEVPGYRGNNRIRIGSQHGLLVANNAIRPSTGSAAYSIQEWLFPAAEDAMAVTTLTGTSTITVPVGPGWRRPDKVPSTATCTWNFTRTDATQQSSAVQLSRNGTVDVSRVAIANPNTPQVSAPPSTAATAPSQPAVRASGSVASVPAGLSAIAGSRSTGTTLTEALPAPGGVPVGGLQVRATSATDVALHWSCVNGSTGYEVFVKTNNGESVKLTPTPLNPNCAPDLAQVNPAFLPPGATPATTYSKDFTQGGLMPGNDYTYVVRALYATGGPADSAPVTVRPLFPPPSFMAWPANPGQVAISWEWSRVSGQFTTGHVISRKLAGESAFRQIATMPYSPYNVYNDNGVPVGTHQYLVEAVDGAKGTPVTVTTGVVKIWQATTQNIVTVDVGFSGVWTGGTVRVLSAPQATGPFTDVTAEGRLSEQHWSAVAQFGSNLHYKVLVTYPNGSTSEAVAQVAVPQASNIGLIAEDAGGGTRLKWNCETGVARYELLRRVAPSGPFSGVGGYAFTVYPKPGVLGGQPTCSYNDTTVPLGNLMEYIVIGFSSKQQGDNPIRAARTSVFVKTWP